MNGIGGRIRAQRGEHAKQKRYETAGKLIAAGQCDEARSFALTSGDLDLAEALGLAAGAVLRPRLSQGGVSDVVGGFEVVGTMWINAIRMTVIPLIVPLLVGAVVGTGSGRSVGALGLKTAAWFVGLLTLAAIIAVPLGTAVFSHLPITSRRVAS